MTTKYVFVTGGVVSSVGKGISAASIGRILKSRGLSVAIQKLDPYLNVDPGTMSPYQHGEVFVTKDGSETDLDLGHYERFIDIELTRSSSVTAGQILTQVIAKERRGDYLGGTIQTVPHVTNAIKEFMLRVAVETSPDVVLVEVGGTVGDIEGQPFLEAIRQMRSQVGRDNVFYIHVTLLPYIGATGELKTKPTQHSVRELRAIGIQPDAILCRSDFEIEEDIKDKIALFCDVPRNAVIPLITTSNIYEVPLVLEKEGIADLIVKALDLNAAGSDMADWRAMVDRMGRLNRELSIAVVGKYAELPDAYLSVKEALRHAGMFHDREVAISWVHSESIERDGPEAWLSESAGIVVPGGFGKRGVEGMIQAVEYARKQGVPYLGLCLGMQVMVMEHARDLLHLEDANSTEFEPTTPHPVIDLMPDQREVNEMGGTMRLGNYPCQLVPGTKAAAAYDALEVVERHRHRFEFNNVYREPLQEAGLLASGLSPDGRLVEIVEQVEHPFMVGVQFHPEFRSRPETPHPLFRDFIDAATRTLREGGQHELPLKEDAMEGD
jgi:CTP synthase